MRVLFLCPKFFGYEKYIKKCLEEKYSDVKMLYTNANSKFIFRFVNKHFPDKLQKTFNKYYKKKLFQDKKYDLLFVIRGENLDDYFFDLIDYKNIPRRCFYNWDSVKNNPNTLNIYKFFNNVFTFDRNDSVEYNWGYRPLFYIKSLCRNSERKNDLILYGSLYPERLQIIDNLNGYKSKFSLVVPKWYYWYIRLYCLLKHNNIYFRNKESISYKKKNLAQMYELYSSSKIVVDYANAGQSGLTMRTIEAYGNGCKLITNNLSLKQESIYDPNWAVFYESIDDVKVPDEWLGVEDERVCIAGYEIHDWLEDMLK